MNETSDDWPGVDKKRLQFKSMSFRVGDPDSLTWELELMDETLRERQSRERIQRLDPVEREALAIYKVDIFGTIEERAFLALQHKAEKLKNV